MKHGKKPTLKQKKEISRNRLKVENWLVVKDTSEFLEIVNRSSGKLKKIYRNK